jgi:hypothetical protein
MFMDFESRVWDCAGEIARQLGICASAIAKAIRKKEGEEKGSGLTFLISHKADFSSSIFLDRWLSNVKLLSLTPNDP